MNNNNINIDPKDEEQVRLLNLLKASENDPFTQMLNKMLMEGPANDFQGFQNSENSFEEISAFKDSPFGQFWEKKIPAYAEKDYGIGKAFGSDSFRIFDLSTLLSAYLADTYKKQIPKDWLGINFIVYANPDGNLLLKQYANPEYTPKDNQVLFFIETKDGKIDFGKIVRVKLGKMAMEKLKDKASIFGKINEAELVNEFLKRSFQIKNNSDYNFVEASKEAKLATKELKGLLAKAIKYDYQQKKFDDMSWFLKFLQLDEYIGVNIPRKLMELTHWMRTKKYEEEKYWNAQIQKGFTPAFLPNQIVPENRKELVEAIKAKVKSEIESLSKYNKDDIFLEKIYKEILNSILLYLFKEFSNLLDEGLKEVDQILPDGEILSEIYNLNAFLVGLWNGCIEFVAGLVDLAALVMIIARDGIGYALTDALGEALENLLNDLVYGFKDFQKKLWKKLKTALKDFPEWYEKYGENRYYWYKKLGELTPDILTFLVPALKAGRAAEIAEVGAKATGEVSEEIMQKSAKELSEKLEQKTAQKEVKESFEKAEQELEEKIPKTKEIEEVKVKGKKTPKEQKVFLKKIDMNVLLRQYADEALTKWKDPFTRPGAVGVLEGEINGKAYQAVSYSSKGIERSKIIGKRHKLVQEWLTEIAEPAIKNRRNHGMCAEPVCISEFLFEAERQLGMKGNSMKIEQAREILSKTKSKAVAIPNRKADKLIHGLTKKACESCNPMLHYFRIKEIK